MNTDVNADNPIATSASPSGRDGSYAPMRHSQESPQERLKRLEAVLRQFDITIAEANDLVVLEDYEMILIADDSASMKQPSVPVAQRQLGMSYPNRWEEMKGTVRLLVDIGACFDTSGLDIFFLNRGKLEGVQHSHDPKLLAAFEPDPHGSTPLTETLIQVAKECGGEKKCLLFILTDGEPDNGKTNFINELTKLVKKESTNFTFKVQIMACTPDEEEVAYLDEVDAALTEVDVTDDYYTEKAQVLKAGKAGKFNRADWCMKSMLGAVSHKFDAWDEGMAVKVANACCKDCVIQ